MDELSLTALASLAGNTLVAAAVTDGWESARRKIAGLFGRGAPDAATERRLDATRAQLNAASAADRDRIHAELGARWAARLQDLMEDDPDTEAKLTQVVREISALLPSVANQAVANLLAAGRDISINSDRGGVAAGVLSGNVSPPGPTLPGLVNG